MLHASNRHDHRGFTLLELLVVVGIIAVVIALLLTGIQKVRLTASRMQSISHLKQIGLAMQQHNDALGRLPGVRNILKITPIDVKYLASGDDPNADLSPLVRLIPYIDGRPLAPDGSSIWVRRPIFLSPADPTLGSIEEEGSSSYGLNIHALEQFPSLGNGFSDGTSNTIAATERYSRCFTTYVNQSNHPGRQKTYIYYNAITNGTGSEPLMGTMGGSTMDRRPTIADRSFYNEVYPLTIKDDRGSTTYASIPSNTFQSRVIPDRAWCGVPQTPFDAGLPTLMFDGSCRTIRAGMDETVFWGAMTRDQGEILPDF